MQEIPISVTVSPNGRGKMGFPSPCYIRDRQRSGVCVVPSFFSNCFWHGLNPLRSIKQTVWRNWEMFPLLISQRNQNYFSLIHHPQVKAPLITVMWLPLCSSPTEQHFRVCGVFYATTIQVQDESFCSWKTILRIVIHKWIVDFKSIFQPFSHTHICDIFFWRNHLKIFKSICLVLLNVKSVAHWLMSVSVLTYIRGLQLGMPVRKADTILLSLTLNETPEWNTPNSSSVILYIAEEVFLCSFQILQRPPLIFYSSPHRISLWDIQKGE